MMPQTSNMRIIGTITNSKGTTKNDYINPEPQV
jgi:hypothetical protein